MNDKMIVISLSAIINHRPYTIEFYKAYYYIGWSGSFGRRCDIQEVIVCFLQVMTFAPRIFANGSGAIVNVNGSFFAGTLVFAAG
jgi:hypothetical protein